MRMEIRVKCFVLVIIKVSIASCFYAEYIVADLCSNANETIIDDASQMGTLKATSHAPYSSNTNCLIVIVPPSGKGVVLSVRKIDMRERTSSCLDYLEVFHADVFTSPTTICRFQYDLKERTSFYSKGLMKILFHVDAARHPEFTFEEGFTLTYTIVSEDMKDCIDDESFMCANGRCMTRDVLCDGRNNCGDRSDESQEICGLNTSTFYFLQMTDILYVIVFCILTLTIVISCGIITFRRPSVDADSEQPTARLPPYQAVHPAGFFICQHPAGPNSKAVHFDGGFANPCYPNGIPPPPYTQ